MQQENLTLDAEQKLAVELSCDLAKRIVAITGQAGTGKTTIIQTVYELLASAGYSVVLCAPTGKAAKRIFEATGIPAMTVHRLLEYPHPGERDPKTGKALITTEPKRDRYNPLEYQVVLCDEFMMVNQEVYRNLIDAIPRGGVIRMFGDANQLAPIEKKANQGMEAPFNMVLNKFDSVRLETIHRQSEGSGIVMNGDRILKGMVPQRTPDFRIRMTNDPVDMIRQLCAGDVPFDAIENQIITPTKKTWVGTLKLNQLIQMLYRGAQNDWYTPTRHQWDARVPEANIRLTVGDKVIWTENNYDLEIFNGETGVIREIDHAMGFIKIDFGDRVVDVPPAIQTTRRDGGLAEYDPQRSIDLAYAITTHKSQGSEYKNVVYCMNKSASFLQNRRNFYTGVTRARMEVDTVTDQKSLTTAVYKKD